jgi:hypothetical protein
MVITAAYDFLCVCDQKGSYKYTNEFGRLRSYGRLKLKEYRVRIIENKRNKTIKHNT